jgi:hypothetical protein
MKHLRIISASLFIAAVLASACTKEKQVVQAEQETVMSQGGGVIETVQRGPNGTNVIFSNWVTKTEPTGRVLVQDNLRPISILQVLQTP